MAVVISILGSSVSTWATERNAEFSPIPKNQLTLLIDSLDPALHSGLYYNENQTLCLGTPNSEALKQELSLRNLDNMETFEIVDTKYSLKDLGQAQDLLLEQMDQTNISAVGFDIANNGLAVFTKNADTRSVDDIGFLTNIPVVLVPDIYVHTPTSLTKSDEQTENSLSEQAAEPRATLGVGRWLARSPGKSYSTLGAWALRNNGEIGFVTTAHGWNSNSNAYSGSTLIGTSTARKASGSADAIFKKNSNMVWGGYRNGNPIDLIDNPRVNDSIKMLGANGTQSGKVMYTNIKGNFEDGYYSDLFCYNFLPIFGDSGSAIIAVRNGSDVLVGINKSQWWTDNYVNDNNTITWGAGCKAFNVENALNFDFAN